MPAKKLVAGSSTQVAEAEESIDLSLDEEALLSEAELVEELIKAASERELSPAFITTTSINLQRRIRSKFARTLPVQDSGVGMQSKRIGFLGLKGFTSLDLVGPIDAFAATVTDNGDAKPRRCYEIVLIGLTNSVFASDSGILFKPHKTLETAPALDTLIIPGGWGLRRPHVQAKLLPWISARAASTRRIASVCAGIYTLAATGLLDGRRVTTHWRFAHEVAKRFPKVKVDPNALFIKDGPFYTSAGVTAGIDLSLALIEEDHGSNVAFSVARDLVVYLKRSGSQAKYSEPLQFQTRSSDQFSDLVAWIMGRLHEDLSVETLARRTFLSSRQFNRRFKEVFGCSPGAFVEELRLEEARRRLAMPNQTIKSVAISVGFKTANGFRRAFERRYQIGPIGYRRSLAGGDPKRPLHRWASEHLVLTPSVFSIK